jgi:hypothetical protein
VKNGEMGTRKRWREMEGARDVLDRGAGGGRGDDGVNRHFIRKGDRIQ